MKSGELDGHYQNLVVQSIYCICAKIQTNWRKLYNYKIQPVMRDL